MITDDSKDINFPTVAVVTGIIAAVGIIFMVLIFTGGIYFWYCRKKTTRNGIITFAWGISVFLHYVLQQFYIELTVTFNTINGKVNALGSYYPLATL